MSENKVKSRTRVVSLRITDDTYEEICLEAGRQAMSPSTLLTRIISKAVADWTLQRQ